MITAKLRVLQWRWNGPLRLYGLAPHEAQAAEYADVMGLSAFERQWCGTKRSRRKIDKALNRKRGRP